jgi:NAD(P)-dependent dehydrogenase (short-subunit alcohol dehydrogenase family)
MALGANILGYESTRVVVTGSASGMGEATARMLGALGAEIHAIDVAKPSIPHAAYYETDLRDPDAIDATVARLEAVGPIDRLFNCAGVPHTTGPLNCMLVNWIGLRYLTEELLPQIVDGGAIASVASDAGVAYQENLETINEMLALSEPDEARAWCEAHPESIREGYSFSKECIIVWTMMRALDLAAQRRIRINCIAPSPTDTAFMVPTIAEIGQEFIDRYPHALVGRMASADEQAGPLVLLNSDLASIVTGTVLYTDQGFAGGLFTGQFDPAKMLTVSADD